MLRADSSSFQLQTSVRIVSFSNIWEDKAKWKCIAFGNVSRGKAMKLETANYRAKHTHTVRVKIADIIIIFLSNENRWN